MRSLTRSGLFIALLVLTTGTMASDRIHSAFPGEVDNKTFWLIYSHGRILEGNVIAPEHPKWGVYEFPSIVEALVADKDWHIIAEHRSQNTDVNAWSDHLVQQVGYLLEAGVKAEHIVLVGFSKGGIITSIASQKLNGRKISTVLLASCWGESDRLPKIGLSGRVLSIFETSDQAASCGYLIEKGNASFTEFSLSTGKGHGAFYQPLSEWVTPLKNWIPEQSNE